MDHPAEPILVAAGLCKRYGERLAVDEVGFQIGRGEIYGLLGPNGAGKTTTISMIAGILPRDAGSIRIDGIDLDQGAPARARIGLVPQAVTLYQDLSGRENLEFWGRLYALRGPALREAVDSALAAVGLVERASDLVGTYSGGMQRRLNLAAGLLHGPALLVLDEPTVGVDPQSRSAIFELVEHLRERGTAVLYTTHYMEEAERLCDRVGIIDAGHLVAEGTRSELLRGLAHEARIEITLEREDGVERVLEIAQRVAGVRRAIASAGRLHVFADDGARRLPTILSALVEAAVSTSRVELVEPNLEDVFLRLTGKALRD